ncbi:hypothetical protein ACD661_03355 [Legionella lytica]|uniref:Uncharacterized protein n=1 Tax=Legionella lytica TaxID=96232 RepID=A0ABW8D4F8_9GAMM
MKMLCINIYTSYSDYTKNEQTLLWNNEVNQDSQTVRAVFHNDTVIDIPVVAQKRYLNVDEMLEPLRTIQFRGYDECHIVLNTHGAAGVNDLSDEVVKSVVSFISNRDIKITQISALQCNGLKGLTASEYREKHPMTPAHQNVSDKPASMSILQGKLCNLETQIEQSFSIHGFTGAYDPVREKDKVERLLLNGSPTSLSVKTKLAAEEDCHTLQKYIEICKTCTNKTSKEYIQATNALGKLLHKMNQNICLYFQGVQKLDDRNKILLQKVLADSRVEENDVSFGREYKHWLKKHKMGSDERLAVFQGYCPVEPVPRVDIEKNRASFSALCYGHFGYFTKSISKQIAPIPELDRACTF